MSEKRDYENGVEKADIADEVSLEEETEPENSKIEAVRLGKSAKGTFSIYFVNLASYAMGTFMARTLPTTKWTIGGHTFSLNPGPFNIKEHALIGVGVSAAAGSAYAVYTLSVVDLMLKHRINALGSMILIITTQCLGYGMAGTLRKYLVYPAEMRALLDGSKDDPSGLWTGANPQVYWGSGLIYGALGPARMFGKSSQYNFIYWGFFIGAILPVIQWGLSKKFPKIRWSAINVTLIAGGMSLYPTGLVIGVICSLAVCVIWQGWLFKYHKNWWSKYTFILSAALDTGAAFTGLFLFLFLQGGLHPKLTFDMPSWFLNYYTPEGTNAPYMGVNRCGAFEGKWESGMLEK
ncbi:hypothetical protein KVV02_003874 [Mortierella alpina]|uniref:Uncharacterized protein n=1 Tax=Mortierella alpina TaxID=64518 RepID=A0A9P8CZ11_MORAP|nr:hypothetical protein KVV02_003874 [Mortierella alpina]